MDDFVSGCECKLLLLINWLILLFMDDPLWHSNSLHTYPTNVSIVDVLKIKQESRVFFKVLYVLPVQSLLYSVQRISPCYKPLRRQQWSKQEFCLSEASKNFKDSEKSKD